MSASMLGLVQVLDVLRKLLTVSDTSCISRIIGPSTMVLRVVGCGAGVFVRGAAVLNREGIVGLEIFSFVEFSAMC